MYPAGIGAALRLKRSIEIIHQGQTIHYAGVSSGSLAALFLALDYDLPGIRNLFREFLALFDRWYKSPWIYIWGCMRTKLRHVLGTDGYRLVNGRLFIGITKYSLLGPRFVSISSWTSNDDLIQTVIASCTVFPLSLIPFRWFRGSLVNDGGVMYNWITLPGYINYVVVYSRLASIIGWFDWSPSTCINKMKRLTNDAYVFTGKELDSQGISSYRVHHMTRTPFWIQVSLNLIIFGLFIYVLRYTYRTSSPRLRSRTLQILLGHLVKKLVYFLNP